MLKYVDVMVSFLEVPDEITLAINISNCPHRCRDCHSSYLQEDVGEELTSSALTHLIEENKGITCVAFLGGDSNIDELNNLINCVRNNYPSLKICWYTGFDETIFSRYPKMINKLDFVKTGEYKEELGPLNSKTTNQKFFKQTSSGIFSDITNIFQND
jgi:anaerobic ribonucleoside-triphosphate reductase activating protein